MVQLERRTRQKVRKLGEQLWACVIGSLKASNWTKGEGGLWRIRHHMPYSRFSESLSSR